jgi:lysophospholipase L1-like esterase
MNDFEKKIKYIFFSKLLLILISSILIFFSFRSQVFFLKENTSIITYIVFQLILLLWLISNHIFFSTFSIIIIFNFFITPIFFNLTFDTPSRYPNNTSNIFWEEDITRGYSGDNHIITTDERGYRVNKKINYEIKNTNTFRVFAIGASTTEEEGLGDKYIWSNNLIELIKNQKKNDFDNFEMINFGVGGLRIIHHYLTLKRNINLNPDVIIFLLGVNDWNHHIVHSKIEYQFPYLEVKYNYELSMLNKISSKIKRIVLKPFTNNIEKSTNSSKTQSENPYLELIISQSEIKKNSKSTVSINIVKVSEEYKYWLDQITKICKKHKKNCIFVDQPSLYSVVNLKNKNLNIWMNPPFTNYNVSFENMINIKNVYNSYLEKYSKENNINFCKISDKIKPTTEFFIDDVHFTPKGSKSVAINLFNCIKN